MNGDESVMELDLGSVEDRLTFSFEKTFDLPTPDGGNAAVQATVIANVERYENRYDIAVKVEGDLQKFWVETPATALYWDVTAEIELKLLIKGAEQKSGVPRVYNAKKNERTYAWPSASLIERVVSAAVADVMSQIQKDNIWNTITNDTMPQHLSN